MPVPRRSKTNNRLSSRDLILSALAAALLLASLSTCPAASQPTYSYLSYRSDITINEDTSLKVRESVTYLFHDTQEWVGLYIPTSYGIIGEGRVLDGEGLPVQEGLWDYERNEDGFMLWCYTGDAAREATFTYEYDIYGSLTQNGDTIGLEWSAVPEDRGSPIEESSVTLHFPQTLDPAEVQLDVLPDEYSGEISYGFSDGSTAFIEADGLSPQSTYSFRCFWPASIMDLDQPALPPVEVDQDLSAVKSWDFERFDADIQINEDASFTVRETQVVNFHGSFHFLNRNISTQTGFFSEGRTYGRVRVRDVQVYYLDETVYDEDLWYMESYDGGETVHIDFEAENEQRGWIIEYRMCGTIIFAPEHDRLYCDAVSEDRDVTIKSSRVTVHLPPGTDMEEVETALYLDPYSTPDSYDYGREGDVLWWYADNIAPYATIAIDVAFPKGVVAIPWQYRFPCGVIVISFSAAFFLSVLAFMLAIWWRRGRDIGVTGSTMVQYDPPEGLRPAMLGMLVNEKPRVEDISATIIDLACRGKLAIIEEGGEGFLKQKEYGFRRLDHDQSDLLPYEREVMEDLFTEGDRVTEEDLVNEFYTHIGKILEDGVKEEVMKRKLFVKDPPKVRQGYYWKGTILAAIPPAFILILNIWFDMGYLNLLAAAFIPAGIAVAAVGWAMPRRSREGSLAYEHALGFKEYMETAEKLELEYMTPENFQRNLPYAMAMGITEKWAEKFQDIYTTPPEWFEGSYVGFSSVYLASSLNSMSHNLNHTLTSSPSSSGSGFSGGGFGGGCSGGGFGGGGSSAG